MRRRRQLLAVTGALLIAFGLFRVVTDIPVTGLLAVAGWMIAAALVHDAVVAPLVALLGVSLTRLPTRARRSVQGALLAGALIAVIAVPLILRHGTQPAAKALLQRDYAAGFGLLLGLIAVIAAVQYCRSRGIPQLDRTREHVGWPSPPALKSLSHAERRQCARRAR